MEDKIKILDVMRDQRINCTSIMLKMKVSDYLEMIIPSYFENGGIEGQRAPLKTKTAIRIRENMKRDIEQGAVLPPLVIGCLVSDLKDLTSIIDGLDESTGSYSSLKEKIIQYLQSKDLSIIDGMQRTTALREIYTNNSQLNLYIRIELWITDTINNLIYRMLVLNTGQISWELKKQLEVVFAHVIKKIEGEITDIELLDSNRRRRSVKPQQYQASHIVELYICFSTRKYDVNLNEKVAEEFAKQDIIEKSYSGHHIEQFTNIFKHLVTLDCIFSTENDLPRRLFGDQYSRIGFMVAMATDIYGRPSKGKSDVEIEKRYTTIRENLDQYIEKLKLLDSEQLLQFVDYETLNELSTGIRIKELPEFYKKAFNVLIETNFQVDSMEECWNFQ